MDGSAAPWRVLDADPEPSPGGGEPAPSGRSVPLGAIVAFGIAALLALVAIVVVVAGSDPIVAVGGDGPAGADASARPRSSARTGAAAASDGIVLVDVQGAVAHPGVVRLVTGSRVGDAIAAAGGYGPRVASDRVPQVLNLAALVHDGDQIVVPSRDDPVAGAGGHGSSSAAGSGGATGGGGGGGSAAGPIDLNRATEAELDALPGIGPVTAAKIIGARTEQPFASVDDLRTRKLVGSATFEKIKTLVAVP